MKKRLLKHIVGMGISVASLGAGSACAQGIYKGSEGAGYASTVINGTIVSVGKEVGTATATHMMQVGNRILLRGVPTNARISIYTMSGQQVYSNANARALENSGLMLSTNWGYTLVAVLESATVIERLKIIHVE